MTSLLDMLVKATLHFSASYLPFQPFPRITCTVLLLIVILLAFSSLFFSVPPLRHLHTTASSITPPIHIHAVSQGPCWLYKWPLIDSRQISRGILVCVFANARIGAVGFSADVPDTVNCVIISRCSTSLQSIYRSILLFIDV